MMTRYRSYREFLTAIEGAPVTIDQWQLEKLALATRKAEGVLLRSRFTRSVHAVVVGARLQRAAGSDRRGSSQAWLREAAWP